MVEFPDYFCTGDEVAVPENDEGYGYLDYECICNDRGMNYCAWERKVQIEVDNGDHKVTVNVTVGVVVVGVVIVCACIILEWKTKIVSY